MVEFRYLDEKGVEIIAGKIKDITSGLATLNEVVEGNAKADAELAEKAFAKVEYNSEDNKIIFKNEKGEEKGYVDTTDFIKDGMIDTVELVEGKLVITFNTDAGKDKIELTLGNIFNADNYYTKEETDETFVKWDEYQGRKVISLENYDNIAGKDTNGQGHNLVMLSKWDVADFGATGVHMNLNTKDIVTINDKEVVATVKDIEEATENVVKYTPFENRKTIALAEGDTISSMGVNFGMVKTYEGLNYPEYSNLNGLMPVLEVGGTSGALVLNTCENVVKVEVVENGKRTQHSVATDADIKGVNDIINAFPTYIAISVDEINAMFED